MGGSVVKATALLLIPGALFGAGLVVSGMTDPGKVLGFLDVLGAWDPSLALVMVGALGAFATVNIWIRGRGKTVFGGPLPAAPSASLDGRLIVGAVLFGVGLGSGRVVSGAGTREPRRAARGGRAVRRDDALGHGVGAAPVRRRPVVRRRASRRRSPVAIRLGRAASRTQVSVRAS